MLTLIAPQSRLKMDLARPAYPQICCKLLCGSQKTLLPASSDLR